MDIELEKICNSNLVKTRDWRGERTEEVSGETSLMVFCCFERLAKSYRKSGFEDRRVGNQKMYAITEEIRSFEVVEVG